MQSQVFPGVWIAVTDFFLEKLKPDTDSNGQTADNRNFPLLTTSVSETQAASHSSPQPSIVFEPPRGIAALTQGFYCTSSIHFHFNLPGDDETADSLSARQTGREGWRKKENSLLKFHPNRGRPDMRQSHSAILMSYYQFTLTTIVLPMQT